MTQELHLNRHLAKKEHDLKKYVSAVHGGSIAFSAPKRAKPHFKKELQVWLRRRRWWLLALFSTITLIVGLLACPIRMTRHTSELRFDFTSKAEANVKMYLWLSCFGPVMGILLALVACSTAGSRFIFTSITTVLWLFAATYVFLVPVAGREALQQAIFLNRVYEVKPGICSSTGHQDCFVQVPNA